MRSAPARRAPRARVWATRSRPPARTYHILNAIQLNRAIACPLLRRRAAVLLVVVKDSSSAAPTAASHSSLRGSAHLLVVVYELIQHSIIVLETDVPLRFYPRIACARANARCAQSEPRRQVVATPRARESQHGRGLA